MYCVGPFGSVQGPALTNNKQLDGPQQPQVP